MKVGLIGPPQSGKSTLYAAITGATLDPTEALQARTAAVKVPDPRLHYLESVYRPKKRTEAIIEFCDFPGISSSDEHGRQQFKKFLPTIRQCDILVTIVRDFRNDSVAAHRDQIDAQRDLDALYEDFVFADLELVMNRCERLEKSLKKPTKTHDLEKRELAVMQRCQQALEQMQPIGNAVDKQEDLAMIKSFAFMTQRPVIAVVNVDESKINASLTVNASHAQHTLSICADVESQIVQLDTEDRRPFLEDLGIDTPARGLLIRMVYNAGGLISFLTAGEDEVRAWPVRRGANAVEAAGKIHSDIARGFIRAETCAYDDLQGAEGDMKIAKANGKVRQEGKDYIVKDGDIINFKFNV